ncbi:hemin uptake protein HemP [Cognatiyoonia sp. IB215182]|uniref:hemin uptake protein HemP n=1 Tax=Cognatiyoonia sp. IB215182 TaxID=3097353 RepID=UPI002A0E7733|nr:hemin uptake protein HemP [Cognatiyoonia sp. IB215182]MDX8352545.1 hemin uptake protein HemP [Cognatiyoonia sp. IB215182]
MHAVVQTTRFTPPELPTYNAEDLTKNGDRAQIVLGDQTYVLRITRAGKLILTK